nr:hypothetical protein [Phytohabitans houttuyneae]
MLRHYDAIGLLLAGQDGSGQRMPLLRGRPAASPQPDHCDEGPRLTLGQVAEAPRRQGRRRGAVRHAPAEMVAQLAAEGEAAGATVRTTADIAVARILLLI